MRILPRRLTNPVHCLVGLLFLLLHGEPARGADKGTLQEYQVKAALLYNFSKFVEWPSHAFPNPPAPLELCILGKDSFGDALNTIEGKPVRDLKIHTRRHNSLDDLEGCQIVFVSDSEKRQLDRILSIFRNQSVLTVADMDSFAPQGGIVGFFIDNKRVRFAVNLAAAERAGLKISSRLLQLAVLVDDKEDR